ncbi:hypothetical protein SAMN04489841_3351 [Natrinema salaciae]|uniref:Uncharacterized protein n=2 Tax=Natrinema salaciae TaxID=1186196 RepID=A0A1H9MGQ3_9EURY|nr:hypothetical protein SAMN04489841_3351 [Natrinema salaciae]
MATENREPTAAAAPGVPTNYKESVVGYDGIGPFKDKKFEFRHTIEWNYDGDDYYANVSSINGETYDWVWSYEGPGAKSDAEYGSFFDHRREGVFEAGITNPTTVTPHIELRGTADGDGRTVSQDDDWPDENLP